MQDSTLLLKTRKFEVHRRESAETGQSPYDFVVHPGAAVILPLLPDDRVVLIANQRRALQQELLELPAGTLDPPEPPLECARRELAEETGYQAGRIELLISFYSSPGFCNELLHAFLATDLTPGPAQLEEGEQIRLAPMPLDEALEGIRAGRIVDGKTIATLLFYECFRRAGGAGR